MELKDEDQFIVIGSDGLFEFLSNDRIMNLAVPYFVRNELKEACDVLVKNAVQAWKDVSTFSFLCEEQIWKKKFIRRKKVF